MGKAEPEPMIVNSKGFTQRKQLTLENVVNELNYYSLFNVVR